MHFLLADFFGGRFSSSSAAHVRVAHPLRRSLDKGELAGFGRKLNWHADVQPHGGTLYTLNLWTPLDPCGFDRPGLQAALIGHEEAVALSGYDAATGSCLPSARESFNQEGSVVERATKFAPIMQPGDVFVLSHWTPHSTYVTPEMKDSRMSVELRLNSNEHCLPGGNKRPVYC